MESHSRCIDKNSPFHGLIYLQNVDVIYINWVLQILMM